MLSFVKEVAFVVHVLNHLWFNLSVSTPGVLTGWLCGPHLTPPICKARKFEELFWVKWMDGWKGRSCSSRVGVRPAKNSSCLYVKKLDLFLSEIDFTGDISATIGREDPNDLEESVGQKGNRAGQWSRRGSWLNRLEDAEFRILHPSSTHHVECRNAKLVSF